MYRLGPHLGHESQPDCILIKKTPVSTANIGYHSPLGPNLLEDGVMRLDFLRRSGCVLRIMKNNNAILGFLSHLRVTCGCKNAIELQKKNCVLLKLVVKKVTNPSD